MLYKILSDKTARNHNFFDLDGSCAGVWNVPEEHGTVCIARSLYVTVFRIFFTAT